MVYSSLSVYACIIVWQLNLHLCRLQVSPFSFLTCPKSVNNMDRYMQASFDRQIRREQGTRSQSSIFDIFCMFVLVRVRIFCPVFIVVISNVLSYNVFLLSYYVFLFCINSRLTIVESMAELHCSMPCSLGTLKLHRCC